MTAKQKKAKKLAKAIRHTFREYYAGDNTMDLNTNVRPSMFRAMRYVLKHN